MFKDLIYKIILCGHCKSKDIELEYLDKKIRGVSFLNMPPSMTLKSYNKINSNLLIFYEAASCDSMKDAVTEVRKNVCPTAAENCIIDI